MSFLIKWIVLPCVGLVAVLAVVLVLIVHREGSAWERERAAWVAAGNPVDFSTEANREVADEDNRAMGWIHLHQRLLADVRRAEEAASEDEDIYQDPLERPRELEPAKLEAALDRRADALDAALRNLDRQDVRWPVDHENPLFDDGIHRGHDAVRAASRLFLAAALAAERRDELAEADRLRVATLAVADDAARLPALIAELIRISLVARVVKAVREAEDPAAFPQTLAVLAGMDPRERMREALVEEAAVSITTLESEQLGAAAGLPYLSPLQKREVLRMHREVHERLGESWVAALKHRVEEPSRLAIAASILAPAWESALEVGATADTGRRLLLAAYGTGETPADPFSAEGEPLLFAEARDGGGVLWSRGVERPGLTEDDAIRSLVLQVETDWLPAELEQHRGALEEFGSR